MNETQRKLCKLGADDKATAELILLLADDLAKAYNNGRDMNVAIRKVFVGAILEFDEDR